MFSLPRREDRGAFSVGRHVPPSEPEAETGKLYSGGQRDAARGTQGRCPKLDPMPRSRCSGPLGEERLASRRLATPTRFSQRPPGPAVVIGATSRPRVLVSPEGHRLFYALLFVYTMETTS
ncbi:hypothetical protein EYF80_061677 [Liparis tanakae]|uniref:Uncharacterized protein n=1 Tax=Liparis tanakae TaxID=230148 RepID=A0A4Z2EHE0_9TELE|nr:hypothetical protein EYF80_061677 [Liparis tanakae]